MAAAETELNVCKSYAILGNRADSRLIFHPRLDTEIRPRGDVNLMEPRYRLFVLGAGFSKPAGFPLADELWKEIWKRVQNLGGRASKFRDDLHSYIDYRRECFGDQLTAGDINFEDFMRFLDVQHFLGLRGSDTWSEHGNEGTIVTKMLIGEILAERSNALPDVPDLYAEFAQRLQPDDTVITFNYDTLLERSLDAVGKPFRLFPDRYKEVTDNSGIVDNDKDEVVILKMHGSIDWFDRSAFENREDLHSSMGAPPPTDVIFSRAEELRLKPITDGPRFPTDPLRSVHRATNLSALYPQGSMFLATPMMLPPSTAKLAYASRMKDFWYGMGRAGTTNLGMAIIGYSLPPQDEYAIQIIHAIVSNYQKYSWGKELMGGQKTPLAIVDFFSSTAAEENFRQRYRFVNWDRATLFGNGFKLGILNSIFS